MCAAFALIAAAASGQEAIRASMAGQDAAEARKRALAGGKYNMQLGPVGLRFSAGLGIEATDNVRLSSEGGQADLILRPRFDIFSNWRATEKNSLAVSLGVGYAKYLNATEFDGLFLAPGSALSFDVYVKDFVINFHDRISYSQDVTSDPTISGIGGLSRLENTLGVNVTWDLNKVIVGAGYDHTTYLPEEEVFSYQSRASELFSASVAYVINSFSLGGIQFGGSLTEYDENVFNDNQSASAGLFYSLRMSEYSSLRASAGYVVFSFDSLSGTNQSLPSVSGVYGDLSFRQRANEVLSHSLSVGQSLQSGSFSETTQLLYVRYDADWRLLRKIVLTTSVSYEQVSESGGLGEKADRYGGGLRLSRPLTEHLNASLGYQFYMKISNDARRDYTQNRLVLDLTYAF